MNKLIYILLSGLLFTFISCNDEEEQPTFNKSIVSPAESFTDPRDQNVYPCVRIGDQIWMTRNLSYQIPGNALHGCFTWEEEVIDLERVSITVDNATFVAIGMEIYNSDPKWEETAMMIPMYLDYANMGLPQSTVTSAINSYCPEFGVIFSQKIDEYSNSPETLNKYGYDHFVEVEEENGNYTKDYGFLYSYDAALAAVPEGWRLPSDEDWKKLEQALGMNASETDKLEAWRGNGIAPLLEEGGETGFNLQRGGANVFVEAKEEKYLNKGEIGYYWSSTKYKDSELNDIAIFRMFAFYSDRIWRGTSRTSAGYRDVLYSVRCVKDAQ